MAADAYRSSKEMPKLCSKSCLNNKAGWNPKPAL
jgi:hypothetical protein